MINITILFHDVVENNNWDSSGFKGVVESRYKLNLEDFREYLKEINSNKKWEVITHNEVDDKKNSIMIAFDDGGISFSNLIIDELDKYNFKGIFFITTNFINTDSFVTN